MMWPESCMTLMNQNQSHVESSRTLTKGALGSKSWTSTWLVSPASAPQKNWTPWNLTSKQCFMVFQMHYGLWYWHVNIEWSFRHNIVVLNLIIYIFTVHSLIRMGAYGICYTTSNQRKVKTAQNDAVKH